MSNGRCTGRNDRKGGGLKAFRIQGTLDFSLIGILAGIAGVLAENKIGIFVISAFHTDDVPVKREAV